MAAIRDSERIAPAYIFTDNKGLVQALTDPNAQQAQQFLRVFHELHRQCPCPVEVHWIPAHRGIPGNENADRLAKMAVGVMPEGPGQRPLPRAEGLINTGIALRRTIQQKTALDWATFWQDGHSGRTLHHLECSPGKEVRAKFAKLSRPLCSAIIQLRTGKISIAKYLHKIGKLDSPNCRLCEGNQDQDSAHILLYCTSLDSEREEMSAALGTRTTDFRELLGNPEMAKYAALIVLKARVLQQFRWVNVEREGRRLLGQTEPQGNA